MFPPFRHLVARQIIRPQKPVLGSPLRHRFSVRSTYKKWQQQPLAHKLLYGYTGYLGVVSFSMVVYCTITAVRDFVIKPIRRRIESWKQGNRLKNGNGKRYSFGLWPVFCRQAIKADSVVSIDQGTSAEQSQVEEGVRMDEEIWQ